MFEHKHTCISSDGRWHYWFHPAHASQGCYDTKLIVPAAELRHPVRSYYPCPDHDGLPNHERL